MLRNMTFSGTLCNVEYKTAASGSTYMTGALKVYQGQEKDDAWYDVIAFNNQKININLADNASDCFGNGVKSLPVIIRGSLEQSTYENKEGKKVKNHKIIADEIAVSVVFGPVFIKKDNMPTQQSNPEPPVARTDYAPNEAPF